MCCSYCSSRLVVMVRRLISIVLIISIGMLFWLMEVRISMFRLLVLIIVVMVIMLMFIIMVVCMLVRIIGIVRGMLIICRCC